VKSLKEKIKHVESSGRIGASRFEPAFRKHYVEGRGFSEAEMDFRATSWGHFQIMGEVLREFGYKGMAFPFCQDAEMQDHFARLLWRRNIRTLVSKLGRHPERWRAVEAWNKGAGGAAKLTGPTEYFAKFERA